jgi:hypothetical protein
MKPPLAMITVAMAVHLFGHFVPDALPDHIFDPHLEAHMRFHVFQSSIWIIGVDLMILIIAFMAFRQKERWAGYALLFAGIPSQLALYAAIIVFPNGAPEIGIGIHLTMIGTMVLYFGGVILGITRANLR